MSGCQLLLRFLCIVFIPVGITQVSEVSSGSHKLKQEFYGDIQIEEWPHYTDTERRLIRRWVNRMYVGLFTLVRSGWW